ncbi:MAG TPA: hypothetical protein VGZ03_07710 [Acidimicrobiales bacterium]|jgi:hypothetical protein|nr:hypothetical protein [Acidimicrobiales bacterium]
MKTEGRGWILFSMVVLLTAGIMRIFDGIWMIHNANSIQSSYNLTGSLFGTSLKTYGWIYLIVGVLLILVALALAGGSEVGRWLGIAAGAVLSISAVWWLPYAPVWSLLYVGLGVGVIYGLAVFGGEQESVSESSTA